MRVLVTGATGFVGSHVCRRLVDDGFEVIGFDQTPASGRPHRMVEGDLLDMEGLAAAVDGCDVVCHIAAIGDVYLAAQHPELAAGVNVTGCAHVAEAARRADARVVYASTWEVYGEPRYEPLDEQHPCHPDHPYNITKLAGEQMLLSADRLQGVPVLALRMGTAFGTGLRPNSVFRIFIDRARAGDPLVIQGDGSQGRQFTHVADIARAFSLACRSESRGMALNVVAPEMVSIKMLAELVVARYPTDLTFGDPRPGDIAPAAVSADKAAEVLQWKAEVPFTAGLTELMDHLESEG